jgi:hypothetical protein
MKSKNLAAVAILLCHLCANAAEDDGGFHSIAEYRAIDPFMISHIGQENIDDLFDTRGVTERLAAETRVRVFRRQEQTDELIMAYWDLERKASLRERLGKQLPTVEVAETAFRPVLALAADFNNYGDRTICGFEAGIAVIIGEEEPDYILVCCFKCHDIHIVRRPTLDHPMPQVAEVGMSPELEEAVFALARVAYPNDKELQSFRLDERKRSKTPVSKDTGVPKDPFSTNKPETPKKKG